MSKEIEKKLIEKIEDALMAKDFVLLSSLMLEMGKSENKEFSKEFSKTIKNSIEVMKKNEIKKIEKIKIKKTEEFADFFYNRNFHYIQSKLDEILKSLDKTDNSKEGSFKYNSLHLINNYFKNIDKLKSRCVNFVSDNYEKVEDKDVDIVKNFLNQEYLTFEKFYEKITKEENIDFEKFFFEELIPKVNDFFISYINLPFKGKATIYPSYFTKKEGDSFLNIQLLVEKSIVDYGEAIFENKEYLDKISSISKNLSFIFNEDKKRYISYRGGAAAEYRAGDYFFEKAKNEGRVSETLINKTKEFFGDYFPNTSFMFLLSDKEIKDELLKNKESFNFDFYSSINNFMMAYEFITADKREELRDSFYYSETELNRRKEARLNSRKHDIKSFFSLFSRDFIHNSYDEKMIDFYLKEIFDWSADKTYDLMKSVNNLSHLTDARIPLNFSDYPPTIKDTYNSLTKTFDFIIESFSDELLRRMKQKDEKDFEKIGSLLIKHILKWNPENILNKIIEKEPDFFNRFNFDKNNYLRSLRNGDAEVGVNKLNYPIFKSLIKDEILLDKNPAVNFTHFSFYKNRYNLGISIFQKLPSLFVPSGKVFHPPLMHMEYEKIISKDEAEKRKESFFLSMDLIKEHNDVFSNTKEKQIDFSDSIKTLIEDSCLSLYIEHFRDNFGGKKYSLNEKMDKPDLLKFKSDLKDFFKGKEEYLFGYDLEKIADTDDFKMGLLKKAKDFFVVNDFDYDFRHHSHFGFNPFRGCIGKSPFIMLDNYRMFLRDIGVSVMGFNREDIDKEANNILKEEEKRMGDFFKNKKNKRGSFYGLDDEEKTEMKKKENKKFLKPK